MRFSVQLYVLFIVSIARIPNIRVCVEITRTINDQTMHRCFMMRILGQRSRNVAPLACYPPLHERSFSRLLPLLCSTYTFTFVGSSSFRPTYLNNHPPTQPSQPLRPRPLLPSFSNEKTTLTQLFKSLVCRLRQNVGKTISNLQKKFIKKEEKKKNGK